MREMMTFCQCFPLQFTCKRLEEGCVADLVVRWYGHDTAILEGRIAPEVTLWPGNDISP